MKKATGIAVIILLTILILIIIITNILKSKPSQQSNQSLTPTLIPHTDTTLNTKTNSIQNSNINTDQDGQTNTQTDLYTSSDPDLVSQQDKKVLDIFIDQVPFSTDDFSIEYSSILNKYIVTLKKTSGEAAFTLWAKEKGVFETLQNENNAIISKKTMAQIHSKLSSELQSTQDSQKLAKQVKLLSSFFNILFSVPKSATESLGYEDISPTPFPSIISPSQIPTLALSDTSIIPTVSQYEGGTSTGNLFPNPLPSISSKALTFQNNIQPCLLNKNTYERAATITGVAWHVLAAIHYNEASCRNNGSLVSGRTIGTNEPDIVGNGGCSSGRSGAGIPIPLDGGGCGFNTLLDSAIYAGNHLKGKIGKTPETFQEVVTAFSRYNGGGNSNCGKTLYNYCPKEFYGEDDPYALNYFDQKHSTMYLVYCADRTKCSPPRNYPRPGALTIMRLILGQL